MLTEMMTPARSYSEPDISTVDSIARRPVGRVEQGRLNMG
jgi:hypothetical protein